MGTAAVQSVNNLASATAARKPPNADAFHIFTGEDEPKHWRRQNKAWLSDNSFYFSFLLFFYFLEFCIVAYIVLYIYIFIYIYLYLLYKMDGDVLFSVPHYSYMVGVVAHSFVFFLIDTLI